MKANWEVRAWNMKTRKAKATKNFFKGPLTRVCREFSHYYRMNALFFASAGALTVYVCRESKSISG